MSFGPYLGGDEEGALFVTVSWYRDHREDAVFETEYHFMPYKNKVRFIFLVMLLREWGLIPEIGDLVMEMLTVRDFEYGQEADWVYNLLWEQFVEMGLDQC